MTSSEEHCNVTDMRAAIEERRQAEAEALADIDKANLASQAEAAEKEVLRLAKSCLSWNEHGDAILYAHLHCGKFAKIAGTDTWIMWTGFHWVIAEKGEPRHAVTKVVNDTYLKLLHAEMKKGEEADDKLIKKLRARIDRLLSCSGQIRVLDMVSSGIANPLTVRAAEIDAKPLLLPCINGVLDLSLGKIARTTSHDYLLRSVPHEFKGFELPAPVWEKALSEIFDGNQTVIDFLQRLLGYMLLGNGREHVFAVLWGTGRNGKGIIMGALFHVLGEFARPIAAELLLDQRNARSSAAPSPDLMALKGIRLAVASESDQGRAFSASRVKLLSGGDAITARNPHDKVETTFRPSHTLFLLTNHKPKAPASDFAFWSRCILLNFPVTFTAEPKKDNERPIDRDLSVKLEAEASGILSWLVRGAALYQAHGLQIPDEVLNATSEYRQHEDIVGQFIEDYCEIQDGAQERAGNLYTAFQKWYAENVNAHRNPPSVTFFGEQMTTKFEKGKDRDGKYYIGVRLVPGSLAQQQPF